MNRVKLALLAAGTMLAMAFTLSCSSDEGGGGGGGSSETKAYALKDVTGEQFTYEETETYYRCRENGELKGETYTNTETINYSISNNTMVWKDEWAYKESDTLNFKGTTNELTGTWTRTKNRDVSCKLETEKMCCNGGGSCWSSGGSSCDETGCFSSGMTADRCEAGETLEDVSDYNCKENWRITKAVFTNTNVSITEDYCGTDYVVDGEVLGGWKTKVIDCNTHEVSKGSDKATITRTRDGFKVSYKGKSCEYSEPSVSKREKACKDAWASDECKNSSDMYCYEDEYYDLLRGDYNKCMSNLLPAGLKKTSESAAQNIPLFKKRNRNL